MAKRLTDLIVNDASLVDFPANEFAKVVLWKRDDTLDRGQSRPPNKAGDIGHSSGRLEEVPDDDTDMTDDTDDVSIERDPDTGKWYLVDGDGNKVGGPFSDKEAAQRALTGSDAEGTIARMAKARQAIINKSAARPGDLVTYAKAYDMVLRENPGPYDRYRSEQRKRLLQR